MSTLTSFCFILIEFIIIHLIGHIATADISEDATLNSIGLATKYGHPPIQYEVVTEDGYILTLFRLPGTGKVPILLSHGLDDSSDTFLIRGNGSLAITLANDGCDVWLDNTRGNRYSRRHEYLNPDTDPEYWDFSFHEMGYYDLPAIIDTILNETGATNLTAIGHSQGTTIYYVLGSCRTEYNSKINVMLSLAPIAYLANVPAPVSTIIQMYPVIKELFKSLDIYELTGDNTTIREFIRTFCSIPTVGYLVCIDGVMFPLVGSDPDQLEADFVPVVVAHYPAGTSSKSLVHYLQVGYENVFAQYDYGTEGNQKVYNSSDPPVYQLDQVTMPMALFAGANDHFSAVADVETLKAQLPNVVYYQVNPRLLFNHIDDVWGKNASDYLFPYIYKVLSSYNHF